MPPTTPTKRVYNMNAGRPTEAANGLAAVAATRTDAEMGGRMRRR